MGFGKNEKQVKKSSFVQVILRTKLQKLFEMPLAYTWHKKKLS